MSSGATSPDNSRARDDKGPGILTTIYVVTALETLFCVARVYTRGRIMRRLQLDDYLIVLSVIMGWTSVAISTLAVKSGNGQHFDLLTTDQKSGAILWTMVGFIPGILSFGIPKLAVVVLLTRLLNPGRAHKIFLWCLATVCLLSLMGCAVVLFGRCTPARSLWDFSVAPESCFDVSILVNYAIYAGSISAFTDLYLAVYPSIVLFQLQMNLRKKIALASALGVGSIATVIAIYKTTRLPALASPDFSFDTSDLVVWTAIEGATIIIAACIPVLQPFIDKIVSSRIFSSFAGSARRGGYNHNNNGDSSSGHGGSKNYFRRGGSSGHGLSDRGGSRGGGGVELTMRSRDRKRPVKDPNALTFLDETRAGSEESILRQQQQQQQQQGGQKHPAAAGGKSVMTESSSLGGRSSTDVEAGHGLGGGDHTAASGIVRTDVVSVSYGQQTPDSELVRNMKDGSRWNAWSPRPGTMDRGE